jgi:cation transport regulator ChaC
LSRYRFRVFPDAQREAIATELREREGHEFDLREPVIELDDGMRVSAVAALLRNDAPRLDSSLAVRTALVRTVSGDAGRCLDYAGAVVRKLRDAGIEDQAVADFWQSVNGGAY